MIVLNNLPWMGLWVVRGTLTCILLAGVAGTACRQVPNVLLFGSMNTTRTADNTAASQWAEPVQSPGLPNLFKVSDDLYRGARPKAEGVQDLQRLGVKTVVNLEQSNGDEALLAGSGIGTDHIPMTAFFLKDDDVVHFLRTVADPSKGPVFVHCRRGADRTGLMCSMYRIAIQGWTKDQAIAEMTQGGFRFNHGYQNVVNYIRDVDVNQIRQRAGLTPVATASPN